jgi:putrescine aminotransferase
MGTKQTSKRTEELNKADLEHIVHPYCMVGEHTGIVFERTRDRIYLIDTEGKEYIDVNAGLMCCNLGHGQKEIQDAIVDAIRKTDYTTCFYGFSNVYVIECAQLLSEITPGDLNHFYFVSGGSEASDTATKIARLYWHYKGKDTKQKIISLYNSYHGETGISTYLTRMGQGAPQRGFGVEPGGYLRIPFYYCYRCLFNAKYPDCDMLCARFLRSVIESEGADSIAAFLAEPIQGSGGVIDPPPEYWPMVRKICTDYDILLICDEVMSGFARTGKMFAIEHWNIIPDMMIMAKGITSAYIPFGAVAFNNEIHETLKGYVFMHALTYSGHPIASAASVAALKLYKKQRVVENAAKVGSYIRQRLEAEFLPLPCVGNIGGKGMFQAVELVNDKQSKIVLDPKVKLDLWRNMLDSGLYGRITGALLNRMFITPPCTMTIEEAGKALDIIVSLVAELKPK